MMKMLLAAAAAFALVNAAPALAACPDCKDCPQHKVASAEKKEGETKTACKCAADTKGECKCGAKCECPHCHAGKGQKEEPKKS